MKLSKAQQNELSVWEYFIPKNCEWAEKTEADITKFFEWSERGLHKQQTEAELIKTFLPENRTYFHALVWGKKRAGINIHELWEADVLKGTMTYFTLLGVFGGDYKWWVKILPSWLCFSWFGDPFKHDPMPRPVVDFMKKEMFKGMDAEIIERCYQSISHPPPHE